MGLIYRRRGKIQVDQVAGIKENSNASVSFETGEIGAYYLYFAQPVTVTKLTSRVTKALAATDNGTITGANATGSSTGGVLTHLASAALADEQVATPTTNNTVAAGGYYKLTTAKTTAGGKATVSVEFLRT